MVPSRHEGEGARFHLLGTLDRKRGIVNVPITRGNRKTCVSMDQGMARLALEVFDGDKAQLMRWIQDQVLYIDNRLQTQAQDEELNALSESMGMTDSEDESVMPSGLDGRVAAARSSRAAAGSVNGVGRVGAKVQASGFSRLLQREILALACSAIARSRGAG